MKVLKFGAKWCLGCKVMKPRWQEIEKENPWLETEFYDFDDDNEKAKEHDVKKLPCFIFLDKNGNEFLRKQGEVSKEELLKIISENKDK